MGGTPNNQQDVDELRREIPPAVENLKEVFPEVRRFMDDPRTETVVTAGKGPNYAEAMLMGQEGRSPHFLKNVVELRPEARRADWPIELTILGDTLHAYGGLDMDGNPQDPKFYGLKQEFIANMTPEQIGRVQDDYNIALKKGATGSSMDSVGSFLNHSWIDGEIRGHLIPDIMRYEEDRERMVNQVDLSDRQKGIINEMSHHVFQQPKNKDDWQQGKGPGGFSILDYPLMPVADPKLERERLEILQMEDELDAKAAAKSLFHRSDGHGDLPDESWTGNRAYDEGWIRNYNQPALQEAWDIQRFSNPSNMPNYSPSDYLERRLLGIDKWRAL